MLKPEGLAYFYPTESLPGSAEEAQRRLEGAIEARLEGLVLKDSHDSRSWLSDGCESWLEVDLGVEVEVDSQNLLVNMMMLLLHPDV